jgi:ribosome recycling factor
MELLKRLEREHKISEDEHRSKGEEVQKLTDQTIKEVDAAVAHKEAEIMQV